MKASGPPDGSIMKQLIGRWQGESKTWFEPGELADTSVTEGTFESIMGGNFLRHRYCGFIRGNPREGEELICVNEAEKKAQIAWMDSFHMKSAIMFSVGKTDPSGFSVLGHYDVGPGHPPWGWRTVYQRLTDDQLRMTAFNLSPDGQEAKAIETLYQRV